MQHCPKCGKQISEADNFCKGCGFNFQAAEGVQEQLKLIAPEMPKCIYHPDRDAVFTCVYCNASFCSDCQKSARNSTYCRSCGRIAPDRLSSSRVQKIVESRQQWLSRMQKTPRTTAHYKRLSNLFALGWLGCWILSIPLALFAPYLSLILAVPGAVCYYLACYYYCISRGQSGAWALLAIFLGIIGLIVLLCLPDRNKYK